MGTAAFVLCITYLHVLNDLLETADRTCLTTTTCLRELHYIMPFLHFNIWLQTMFRWCVQLCSIHAKQCYTFILGQNFQNLPCKNFVKITFSFSQNAQPLRIWKSSLTQIWIHSTVFEILTITYSQSVLMPILTLTSCPTAPQCWESAFLWHTI